MNKHHHQPPVEETIAQQAAQWILCQDRGLSAVEQDALSQWLAADPRHGAALAEHRWGWEELDRLAGIQTSVHAVPDPDLLVAPPQGRSAAWGRYLFWAALPLAAAAVAGIFLWRPTAPVAAPALAAPVPARLAGPIEVRMLEDGSVIELNRGAAVEVAYTPGERRVQLIRGEASFIVAKNRARPFVVAVGGVGVRAVGTVFDVRLGGKIVDVLVAEGKVRVDQAAGTNGAGVRMPVSTLDARQQASIGLAPAGPPPVVTTLTDAQMEERLAWRPRLLDFTDTPLPEIASAFNRHNAVRLVISDPALGAVRLSASFRSDNVEGFVRLMESEFGMRATWRGETELVLSTAK